ncbi:hypothetical protein FT663_00393 [Candidozyma haemuli var. vulneris]|uniref:Uncharacterized protein n=1 Tax=Candidozyma haemuli TaxID=45357 RepID=A0A2V1AU47_9ASCO|nr:hypothetical protein CXQ85_000641 [[Candida] haemuloni]KAF3988821.1 hypothetical protein FT662_03199 [[Candida] haemuloni var. vulneris]KAF3995502.1 hypothetical protein FT663_00393 [[Candida] haemuloni var. vulneris]PVH21657.1 hypothetical protein CXQ85_000641 [[Candida] haemuloni]
MFLFFIFFAFVTASSYYEVYMQMLSTAPEVETFNDVTIEMLTNHGTVKVKDDNSVIISEFLTELMSQKNLQESFPYDAPLLEKSPGQRRFIQTCFKDLITETTETSWVPIEGCVDNSYSSTTTTFSRAIEGKISNSMGPSVTVSLLGVDVGIDPRLSSGHILSSKLSCDVPPGEVMQLFSKHDEITVSNIRQRKFSIAPFWKRPLQQFEVEDWESCDGEENKFTFIASTACITDPNLLQCEED